MISLKTEYKVPLIFLIISLLWIVFSDMLLFDRISLPKFQQFISTLKGIIYVTSVALIIYLLLKRDFESIRKSEIALFEKEEYYFNTFLKSRTPSILSDSESLMIIDANESTLKLFRVTKSELKVKKLNDLFVEGSNKIIIERDGNINDYTSNIRTSGKNSDSQIIDLEVFTTSILYRGKFYLYSVLNNISEKIRIEKSLIESELRYKKLVENIPDVIYIYSKNYGLIYISPKFKEIFGVIDKKEQFYNDILLKSVNIEDKNTLLHFRNQVFSTFEPTEINYRITSSNGKTKWLSDKVFTVNTDGSDIVFEGVLSDITEKRLLIEQLMNAHNSVNESLKLKNVILSNINHELRTPLNGIIGFTRLLQKTDQNQENKEFLDYIIESAYRLNTTLSSLLTLNEIEAGHRKLYYEETSVKEFLKIVYDNFYKIAQKKNIILRINTIDDIKFETDTSILSQIFFNLIENAIKFTDKGSITVSGILETKADIIPYVRFIVKDTGIGISPERLMEIFDEFRQESEGINRKFEGMGLGLTISKKLISLINGKIYVNSTQNHGSEFIFEIPIKQFEK